MVELRRLYTQRLRHISSLRQLSRKPEQTSKVCLHSPFSPREKCAPRTELQPFGGQTRVGLL